jgi:MFS family permease
MLGMATLAMFNEGAFMTLFPLLLKALGRLDGTIGDVLAVQFVSLAAFSIPAAALTRKAGRKRAVIIGSLLIAFASVGYVLFANTYLVYLFAAALGCGSSFVQVNTMPFLHDYSNQDTQPYAFGLVAALGTIAMFIGTVAGGAFADTLARAMAGWIPLWQVTDAVLAKAYGVVLILSGTLTLGIAGLMSFVNDRKWVSKAEGYLQEFAALLKQRLTWSQVSYTLLIGVGSGMVVPFFPVFLRVMLHAPASVVGGVQGASMLMIAVGTLLTPMLIHRFGRVRTINVSQAISLPFILGIAYGPLLVLLGFSPLRALFVTGLMFIIRNTLMNLVNPVNNQLLMDLYGERQRLNIISLNIMVFPLGRAIGTKIGGNMMASINYQAPYWVTLALYAVGIGLYYLAYAKIEREFQRRVKSGEDMNKGIL